METAKYQSVLQDMQTLFMEKNSDYGNSVHRTYEIFGMTSYLVRISDKLNRAISLTSGSERMVKDETLYDTLVDLANYAAIAASELKQKEGENNV